MTIDRSRPVHTGTAPVRALIRLSMLMLAGAFAAPTSAQAIPARIRWHRYPPYG